MKVSVWQRLDLVARQILPSLLTIIMVMLAVVPLRIPGFAPVMPALAMIAVFYWSVHRPDLLPAPVIFFVGLFQDLLLGAPLGVNVVGLLAVHFVVAGQRRFFASRSFAIIWFGFVLVAFVAFTVIWLLAGLLNTALLSPRPFFFQYLTTIGAYPLLAWIFALVQRALLR